MGSFKDFSNDLIEVYGILEDSLVVLMGSSMMTESNGIV